MADTNEVKLESWQTAQLSDAEMALRNKNLKLQEEVQQNQVVEPVKVEQPVEQPVKQPVQEPIKAPESVVEPVQEPTKKEPTQEETFKAQDREIAQKIEQETKVLTDFRTLMEQGADKQKLATFVNENPDYRKELGISFKTFYQNKQSFDFQQKYATATPEKLYNAVYNSDIVVWSQEWNTLPETTRQQFEQYAQEQLISSTPENRIASIDNDLNKVLNFNDYLTQIGGFYSLDLKSEYEKAINAPEINTKRTEVEGYATQLKDLEDEINAIEDEVQAEYEGSGRSQSFIDAQVAKRQRLKQKEYNQIANRYQTSLASYQDMKTDIDRNLKFLEYENEQQKQAYQMALSQYNTDRARMDSFAIMEFEQQNAILAEQRKIEAQKELVLFQEEINKNKWGDLIDDGNWNLQYIKDGVVIRTLSGLWKPIASFQDAGYDWKSFDNEDGTNSVVIWDKNTNTLQEHIFWAGWDIAGWYIGNLWSWKITSYWWPHDNFQWLDIDGNIWDPIYMPTWGRVLKVEDYGDKTYGKSVVVELSDWNIARFSHLDSFNGLSVWDYSDRNVTFDRGAVIWTMGNTWYTIPWVWWDGSHLDIVINGMSGVQVEEYLKNIKSDSIFATDYNNQLNKSFARYNSWEIKEFELERAEKVAWGTEEFSRQAYMYGKKLDAEQALPKLQALKSDLKYLLDNVATEWAIFSTAIPKTKAVAGFWDAWAILDNVVNKKAFSELLSLKQQWATFGALTEKEFKNIGLSTEVGKLKLTASDEVWQEALNRMIWEVETYIDDIKVDNPFLSLDQYSDDEDVLDFLNEQ